mmetsp:Transcript_15416/g.42734  ORF Transcript_15416/g.42734 Transcript_15416/m.42734 type:complete len:213 (+) Transcript_15416:2842-3480(+)
MVVHIIYNQILKTRQPHLRSSNVRELSGSVFLRSFPDCLDMGRCGSTAPPNHIQPSILEEYLIRRSHVVWGVIITSHSIWKTSIGVHLEEALRYLVKSLHKRNHVGCSKSTVDTNTHGLAVTEGYIECLSSLSRQCSSRLIHQSTRDEQRDIQSSYIKVLSNSIDSCLCIESIKDSFHHQDITTSINQTNNLFKVGINKLIKGYVSGGWILH